MVFMQLSDATRLRIKRLLKANNMKVYDLCKTSGIPCSTLSDFMNNKTKLIKLDTLLHICEGFNITLVDFFDNDLFIEVEQD